MQEAPAQNNGSIVFLDNLEAGKMGSHVRLIRFPYSSIVLKSIRILSRDDEFEDIPSVEQSPGGSFKEFEIRTFPKRVRPSSLAVYVRDRLKPEASTYTKLKQTGPYHFVSDRIVTDEVIVKGEYVRLALAMYGEIIPEEDCPPTADPFCPREARKENEVDLLPLSAEEKKFLPGVYRLKNRAPKVVSDSISSTQPTPASLGANRLDNISGCIASVGVACLDNMGGDRAPMRQVLKQLPSLLRGNSDASIHFAAATFPLFASRLFEIARGAEGHNCQQLALDALLAASEHACGAYIALKKIAELKKLQSESVVHRLAPLAQETLKTLIERAELYKSLCDISGGAHDVATTLDNFCVALRKHTAPQSVQWDDLLAPLPADFSKDWLRSLPQIPDWLRNYFAAQNTLAYVGNAHEDYFPQVRQIFAILLPCCGAIELFAEDPELLDLIVGGLTEVDWRHVEEFPEVPLRPERCTKHELGVFIAMLIATSTLTRSLTESMDMNQLRALHRLAIGGEMSAQCVIRAFRPAKCMQWLLDTLEARCTGLMVDGSTRPNFAELRHLVAILHCIVLQDRSACLALRFGDKFLETTTVLMERIVSLPRLSEEDDLQLQGGMRLAAYGRREQDVVFDQQVKDLVFQLKPFEKSLKMSALLEAEKYSFHRVEDDMRETAVRGTSIVGGLITGGTVSVWEVETSKDDDDQLGIVKLPLYGWDNIPLLSWMILAAKTELNAQFALEVFHQQHKDDEAVPLSSFLSTIIRCCAALNSNLEQLALCEPENRGNVAPSSHYVARERHLLLLENVLKALYNVLRALHLVSLDIFRQQQLLQVLLCVMSRLLQIETPMMQDRIAACISGVCRVIRAWNQLFPKNAAGQLWPKILRFGRVLPQHYKTSMFLLTALGDLWPDLMRLPPNFHLSCGADRSWLKPMACPVPDAFADDDDRPPPFDDFLGSSPAAPSIREALRLVRRVSAPTERLYFGDFQEFIGQCLMCAVTSNSLLHCLAARSLVLLSDSNVVVVKSIVNLGVEAMRNTTKKQDEAKLATLGRLLLLLDRMARLSTDVGRQVLEEHEFADIFLARLLSMTISSPAIQEMADVIIRRSMSMLSYIIERYPTSVSTYRSVAKTLNAHILERQDRIDMACDALKLLKAMSSDSKACTQLMFNHKGQVSPAFRLDRFAKRAIDKGIAKNEMAALCSMLLRTVTNKTAMSEVISSSHLAALGPAASKPAAEPIPPPATPYAKSPLDVGAFVNELFEEAREMETSTWALFVKMEITTKVNDNEWLFNRQILRRKRRQAREKIDDDLLEKKRRRLGIHKSMDDKSKLPRDFFRARKTHISRAPSKHVDALGKTAVEDLAPPLQLAQQPPPHMPNMAPALPFIAMGPNGMPIFQNMLMIPGMFPMGAPVPLLPMPPPGTVPVPNQMPMQPTQPQPQAPPPSAAPTTMTNASTAGAGGDKSTVNGSDNNSRAPVSDNPDMKQTAVALQKFLADHPEYMRVLKDPVKTLADPRVKSHLQAHLQNYPLVKAFLETRGLKL
eukprot:GEMP01001695.1.p1 GENE.GEMP01001695.1~~GEMP01001695.1.p1  ORF type:complete len:1546 (+),score=435.45 GEMP01001695.1:57-4640(+)